MKELSIEEKAKAYDNALKEAVIAHKDEDRHLKATLERIFPELKESEDENIRKELICFLETEIPQCNARDKYIAWLEKQGEKKPDKVEPKFHEGEWITNGDYIWQIVSVTDLDYILQSQDGNVVDDTISYVNEQFHSFAIQDAKDGDVLFLDLMEGKTFIYNGVNPDMAILYSFIISNDGKDVLPYHIGKPNTGIGNVKENKNIIHPATKEQRDKLEKAMADAGYRWNADEKKLEKIEQKPADKVEHKFKVGDIIRLKGTAVEYTIRRVTDTTYYTDGWSCGIERCEEDYELVEQTPTWGEEDEDYLKAAIWYAENPAPMVTKNAMLVEWLKNLRGRVQPQPKQEWSEEDENRLSDAVFFVREYQIPTRDKRLLNAAKEAEEWLSSLRPHSQWKPSELQLECLGYAIDKAEKDWSPLTNNRIYLTLKALKEQLLELKGSKV